MTHGETIGTVDAPSRLDLLQYAPPYPGTSVVAPALIPSPPLLDAEAGDDELAVRALEAYRMVAEARTRKRCYVLRNGPGRFRGIIAPGARKLAEHSIPPIAWCGWSFDLWAQRSSALPPVPFAFGHRRIETKRGWFWSEAGAYMGGNARYGAAHLLLLQRWQAMAREIHGARSREEAEAIARRWFPGRAYERMVTEAVVESQAETARLHDALRRGEWLW